MTAKTSYYFSIRIKLFPLHAINGLFLFFSVTVEKPVLEEQKSKEVAGLCFGYRLYKVDLEGKNHELHIFSMYIFNLLVINVIDYIN